MTTQAQLPPAGEAEEDALAEDVSPVCVLAGDNDARVIEAAIRLRRNRGNLPGRQLDPKVFGGVMTDYQRGQALTAICAAYILANATG